MKIDSTFIQIPVLRGFREIECVWELAQQFSSMVCGGYARYCCSQRRKPYEASDVDLFPQSEEASGKLIEAVKAVGFAVKHENEISVTFDHLKEHSDPRWIVCPTIQVIKPVLAGAIVTVGTMEAVLNNFDFTIVRVGLLSPTMALADSEFLEDDKTCKLRFKNIHCPISSTLRAVKYSKKGFWMGALECSKLFIDWSERGEEYRVNLLDLLDKMKTPDGEEPSKEDIEELEKLMNID